MVELRATNLSYPNSRIIDATKGTNTISSKLIPVSDAITANNIIITNINFFPKGLTLVTMLSSNFLYDGVLFSKP